MKKPQFKKVHSSYSVEDKFILTVNEEFPDHVSISDYSEACSGFLKHWGTRAELIKELELAIEALKEKKLS